MYILHAHDVNFPRTFATNEKYEEPATRFSPNGSAPLLCALALCERFLFLFTSANVNEKRLDRVRDACEIDSLRERYIALSIASPREERKWNLNDEVDSGSDIFADYDAYIDL